jgi:hypothetical protein
MLHGIIFVLSFYKQNTQTYEKIQLIIDRMLWIVRSEQC